MKRLRPTTADKVETVSKMLYELADEIEEARPFLAGMYRGIAKAMQLSLYPIGSPMEIHVPNGSSIEMSAEHAVKIFPKDYDAEAYWRRATK